MSSSSHNTDPVVYHALADILQRVCAIHSKLYELEYSQKKLERRMARICAEMGLPPSDTEGGPSEPPPYASSPPPSSPRFPPPPPAQLRPLSASNSHPPPHSPSLPSTLSLPSTVPETEGSGFPDVTDPWQEEDGETGQAA
ncbi:hypothetical protein AAP_00786 [Ascosphaera apis ARSEF 7405]|uniref:Uncharacterized protein n=1 Tax=Ascosphaera apis ARSEF 7405 TaxID=392613 RepID=A0A162IRE4_9EURO|nr:hypothetical protein AAP_00786 [Ascosphaera apis ARSEF 7405]